MICSKCGYNNKEGSQFCRKCGQKLAYVTSGGTSYGNTLGDGLVLQSRYKITRQLGKGGMGVVYLASDNRFSNRVCVVKEMLEFLLNENEKQSAITRFNQEADLLAAINHPNIPQVYDRFSEGNRHYLVMEFVEGMDLKDVLMEHMEIYNKPIPEEEAAIYFIQLCLTLRYLHSYNPPILHRDIKPPNVLLTKEGKVKLVDFGIAKAIQNNTQGTSIGTQGYAAPEQYKGLADARTDIYALGATMHHLLTGRDPQMEAPFDYPDVKDLNNEVSREMSDIIMWMLQMNADSRPQNIDMVIGRLKGMYPEIEQRVINNRSEGNKTLGLVTKKLAAKAEVISRNICSFCGSENKSESRFCKRCGKPIGSSANLSGVAISNPDLKMIVQGNSRILHNYPGSYGECIRTPDKSGNIMLNVVLERCFMDGMEFIYITEKLPAIVGKEVFAYNVVRNAQGTMQYIKPVADQAMKIKLFNYWQQLL